MTTPRKRDRPKKSVKMQSWHELFEASDRLVVDHTGPGILDGPMGVAMATRASSSRILTGTSLNAGRPRYARQVTTAGGTPSAPPPVALSECTRQGEASVRRGTLSALAGADSAQEAVSIDVSV
jgi:hypothetical protein